MGARPGFTNLWSSKEKRTYWPGIRRSGAFPQKAGAEAVVAPIRDQKGGRGKVQKLGGGKK